MDIRFKIVDTGEDFFQYQVVGALSEKRYDLCRNQDEAEKRKALREWEAGLPVGQRTSNLLTEVRSVLSKIETTLKQSEWAAQRDGLDEEDLLILHDLRVAAGHLEYWRRTGRSPRPPEELR